MKECISCKENKQESEYNKNKNAKDGLKEYCRKCASLQNAKYREKNRELINSKKRKDYWKSKEDKLFRTEKELKKVEKECTVCNEVKSIHDFYKRGNGGFYNYCKTCHIKKTNKYASDNIEKTRKNRISREQRRRARKNELINDFTKVEWLTCMKYFEDKCAYCGGSDGKITQDHFTPVSKGGHYTESNIVPACFSCNTQKHNTLFPEWYKTKSFFCKGRKHKIYSYLKTRNGNSEPSALEIM